MNKINGYTEEEAKTLVAKFLLTFGNKGVIDYVTYW